MIAGGRGQDSRELNSVPGIPFWLDLPHEEFTAKSSFRRAIASRKLSSAMTPEPRDGRPKAIGVLWTGPSGSMNRWLVGSGRFPIGRGFGVGVKNHSIRRLAGSLEEETPDHVGQWKGGRHNGFSSVFRGEGARRNPAKLLLIRCGVELSFDQGGVGGDGDGRKGVPANRLRT